MRPWVADIKREIKESTAFRSVVYTGLYSQLTIMSLRPGEDAGGEQHPETDQFVQVESGTGLLVVGASEDDATESHELHEGWGAFIPAGTWHNIINTGTIELKLSSLYSPVLHPRQIVYETKEESIAAKKDKDRQVTMGMAGADGFGA